MNLFEILIAVCLIAVSSFMSASEVALFSLSRFQLRGLKDQFRSTHRRIKRLLGDPGGLLITILVTNEIVNIALSSLVTESVTRHWQESFSWVSRLGIVPAWAQQTVVCTLITTPIVLFLCEVTPKVIGVRGNQLVATLAAGPLSTVYDLFKPVRIALQWLIRVVSRRLGGSGAREHEPIEQKVLNEQEFLSMIEEGHKEGAIHESELELIKNVFELDDTTVKDVYTPLNQVYAVPRKTTVKAALQLMRGRKFSRIPVFGATRKQVVGVLYAKDLLLVRLHPDSMDETIESLMRKPFTVQPSVRLSSLFRRLKKNQTHLAVVETPQGEALGIVTMADVLDALLEDVLDKESEEAEGALV